MSNNKLLKAIPKILFILIFIFLISIIESQDIYYTIPHPNPHAISSTPEYSPQYDVSGTWKMVANTDNEFDLELQLNDNMITGTMTHTNGQEPVDIVSGFVYSDGKIVFNRARPGIFTEVYTGKISSMGSSLSIEGTFTHDGEGRYPWSASKSSGTSTQYGEDLYPSLSSSKTP